MKRAVQQIAGGVTGAMPRVVILLATVLLGGCGRPVEAPSVTTVASPPLVLTTPASLVTVVPAAVVPTPSRTPADTAVTSPTVALTAVMPTPSRTPADAAALSPTVALTPEAPLRGLAEARGLAIGAAVSAAPLRREEAYREVLAREFNFVTPENALKFGPVHPAEDRYAFDNADAIVAFAEENGMQVRGHTLVWHQQVPGWVKRAAEQSSWDQARWEQVMQAHITTVVGRYRGRIQVWDVVNEAVDEGTLDGMRRTVWYEGIGETYIDQAFRWAHEADPDALLFYNDYCAEDMGLKSRRVYELVSGMIERGVPIHGVGLQMHVTLDTAPDGTAVQRNMARLGELGLQVHITEMDVRVPEVASADALVRQAAIYGRMMDACLQVEACTGFILWGFTDKHSWIPYAFADQGDALIFDARYAPKPAYGVLQGMLEEAP